jgi:hypothetical protein
MISVERERQRRAGVPLLSPRPLRQVEAALGPAAALLFYLA